MGIIYGNFEILEELPSWSSGVVYRAKNRNTGDMAAIKIMDMSTVQEGDRADFYETASRSIPLEHNNIAKIIDVCKRVDVSLLNPDDRQIECAYVVQEFVQGISLNKVIKKQGPFLPQLGFYIIQQLAEAMAYAYSKSVPHRNLTMANVILMRDGSIKLSDHGIGRLFSTGTVYYMSPEDVSGQEITERSEIFTTGILLFEILLGRQPFQGDDFADLMNKIAAGQYNVDYMNGIPEFMRSVILKCLAKNPDERYQNFNELLDEVINVQGTQELYAYAGPLDPDVAVSEKREESGKEGEKPGTQTVRKPDEPVEEKPVSEAPVSLVEKLKAALAVKEKERRSVTQQESDETGETAEKTAEHETGKKGADFEVTETAEQEPSAEAEQETAGEETGTAAEQPSPETVGDVSAKTDEDTEQSEYSTGEAAGETEEPVDAENKSAESEGGDTVSEGVAEENSREAEIEAQTERLFAQDAAADDEDEFKPLTQEMKMMIPGYSELEETEDSAPSDALQEVGEDVQDDDEFGELIAEDLNAMEEEDFQSTAEFLRKKTETEAEIEAADTADTGGVSAEDLTGPSPVETPVSQAEEPPPSPREFDDPFLQMLADVPMFQDLDTEYLMKFRNVIKTRNFTDGHRIIEYGQPGEFLYILLDGSVAVLQEDADGNEIELTELSEGDCFGEMSLLTGDPCSATIRSKGATTLLSLNKDDFQVMLAENAKISAHFNKILIQRLRKTNLKFENEIEKGMVGKLDMISLTELIQTIMLGQKTGKLFVTRRTDEAVIYFVNGNVKYCKHGRFVGERAFYGLLEWNEGTFKFAQGTDTTIEQNVEIDTNGLLMEGSRRMDESSRLIDYIGSLKRVFLIEGEIMRNLGILELSEEAQNIATLFNGKDTIAEIIDKNDDFELESLEAIIELYTKDLLTGVTE